MSTVGEDMVQLEPSDTSSMNANVINTLNIGRIFKSQTYIHHIRHSSLRNICNKEKGHSPENESYAILVTALLTIAPNCKQPNV